jgi:hypothetical protein
MRSILLLLFTLLIEVNVICQPTEYTWENLPANTSLNRNSSIIIDLVSVTLEADYSLNGKYKIHFEGDKIKVTKVDSDSTIQFNCIENGIELSKDALRKIIKFDCSTVETPFGYPTQKKRNIYYDAKLLLLNNNSTNAKLKEYYKWKADNIYLKDVQIGAHASGAETESSKSSSYGLDVTKYADGLVRHIIAQFKKEMAYCFFNDFKAEFKKDEYRDLRILFANTYGVLDLIDDKIYDFEPYMTTLRSAMERDLKRADKAVFDLIQDPRSQLSAELNKEKNVRFLTNVGFHFYNAVRDSIHIGRALQEINTDDILTNTEPNVVAAFETLRLFNYALKDISENTDDPYWISTQHMDELLTNPKLLQYFIGLVITQAEGINYGTQNLANILNDNSIIPNVIHIITDIRNIASQIKELHQNNKNTFTDQDKENEVDQYFSAANQLLSLLEGANYFKPDLISPTIISSIRNILNTSAEVYKGVYSKQYTLAVLSIGKLFNTISTNKNENFKNVIKFITEKGIFIAQMAEAKTADDVKSILQQYAAPSGSWRDKRTAGFNVSIDSYLGGSAYLDGKKSVRYGTSTPVGISVSTSLGKKWALTFLGSVVDLGPITAYRFSNDTSDIAKIYLKEILAPGFHASLLIPICDCAPLTINGGYQQYPLLTKAGSVINEVNISKKYGWVFGINYNIPLFTIINSK